MIVLTMIVKDEAPVIRRCLESVKPFIDAWVIVDTGSSDATFSIVEEVMDGIPGHIGISSWKNFAHNRNEVLDIARMAYPDAYALTIDADEVLAGFPALDVSGDHDGYMLPVEYAGTRYDRLALVRLDKPWRWEGVVHELLTLEGADIGYLPAPTIVVSHDGARSRDPETYRKDAALLEAHLAEHPDDPRAQFYLAQSYRDAGAGEAAIRAYTKRAANESGYQAERWHSLWQMAQLYDASGTETYEDWAAEAYLDAYDFDPTRAESLVDLARLERLRERFSVALMYAREACRILQPDRGALFVDQSAYTWRCWDERAMAAYYCGEYVEAAQAARTALSHAPEDPRLQENLRMCEAML